MTLYIFDKDGTLIQFPRTRMGVRRPILRPEDQMLAPRVFEKVAKLRAAGHKIALTSDQSDVAEGLLSLKEAEILMQNVAAKIGGVDAWRMSPYNPKGKPKRNGRPNPFVRDDPSRKPHPGMLLDLMKTLRHSPRQTIMIGDSKDDEKAAEAAGVRFIRAKEFFKKI